MAGYIRQSTFVDGDTITAALFNNEYNQLVNAFSNTSGHKHDGTTAEGPVIGLIGDAGETSPNNKVLIDTTNNHIEFYVEVSSNPVQQIYIADGAIIPVTDSDVDLGTSSLYFKDAYIDSVTTTGNVSVGGNLTVTGNATISGNLTFGDADTDSINLSAEIDSHIIPNTNNTYDLGTATKQWRNIFSAGTLHADAINFNGTAITATAAELNILDGVTSTAAELNLLDGVTSTTAELNILDGVTATATEINLLDGVTSTTAELNILDGVTATTTEINLLDGVTSTTAELNILDGVTSTAAEINLLDGSTANTVVNSKAVIYGSSGELAGTLSTAAQPNITSVGTLTGLTTTGDINFGDDDKAIFGAGSDLQIFHDGDNSFIKEIGTGDLRILASAKIDFRSNDDATVMIRANAGGSVDLRYAGDRKLETTSTGIDVTGTVTADGLTVDDITINASTISDAGDLTIDVGGDLNFDADGGDIVLKDGGTAFGKFTQNSSNFHIVATIPDQDIKFFGNDGGSSVTALVLDMSNAGKATFNAGADFGSDIDVTGTVTADGLTVGDGHTIGDDSFDNLVIEASTGENIRLVSDHATLPIDISSNQGLLVQTVLGTDRFKVDASTGDISFYEDTGTSAALFWDASAERLGIGNTNPSTALDVTGTVTSDGLTVEAGIAQLQLIDTGVSGSTKLRTANAQTWLEVDPDNVQASSGFATYIDGKRFFNIEDTGDISFYDDTGTTAALYWDASAESLGIGVTNPSRKLTVSESSQYAMNTLNPTSTAGNKSGIAFHGLNSASLTQFYAGISANFDNTAGGAQSGSLIFETINSNSISERMRIDSSGNVGINTTSPSAILEVRATAPTYTNNGTVFWGGTTNNDNHNGIMLSSYGDALGGSIGSNLNYSNGTVSQSNTNRSSGEIQFGNTTGSGVTSDIKFGGYVKGTTTFSERMRIDSSGNVGIGTNNPVRKLHLQDSGTVWLQLTTENTSGGTVGLLFGDTNATTKTRIVNDAADNLQFWTSTEEKMRIDTSGNVGIGTSSPSAALEVTGATLVSDDGADDFIKQSVSGNTSTLTFGNTEGTAGQAKLEYSRGSGKLNGYIGANSAVNFMTVKGTGEVGLSSQSNPEGLLHIGASSNSLGGTTDDSITNLVLHATTSNADKLLFTTRRKSTGTDWQTAAHRIQRKVDSTLMGYMQFGSNGDDLITFGENATERMRIDGEGNVGIGTSSPNRELELSAANPRFRLTDTDGGYSEISGNSGHLGFTADAGNTQSGTRITFDVDDFEAMRINSLGDVIIGKTASTNNNEAGIYMIQSGAIVATRSGDTAALFNRTTNDGSVVILRRQNVTVGSISVTASATTYNTSSDARLKDVTGEARGLEVINELNPVSYNWKADGKADEGLIAQEVKELVPNAVSQNEEDKMYQMDYSKLIVHLVKGMKEQQTQIEALQSEINLLKGE